MFESAVDPDIGMSKEAVPQGALMSAAELEAFALARPFHLWMGMRVLSVDASAIELSIEWRDEYVSNPDQNSVHGGILAALIDGTASYALTVRTRRTAPTVDLRIDYHQMARSGPLRARGVVLRLGATLGTGEATIHDDKDRLIASGRGVFFTGVRGA